MILAQQNIFPASTALADLVQRLVRVVPPHLSRFFFCNSGSEAVDNAVKIARCAAQTALADAQDRSDSNP